jgi:NAD(P)-dependent dehydrogenase (short-subunit alcohol dehydrogenase family)
MRFQGRNVLLTGAASGIGRATAVRLAEEGARLVVVDINFPGLQETLGMLHGSGHVSRQCDLTNETAVMEMADRLRDEVSVLSGLVHCAGIHWLRPLQITDSAALLEMLASHVVSSIAITRAMVTKRLASKEGCSIVWFSSAAALQGGAGTVAYAAAKGALISAGRVLAVELARRKIRINVIAPGVVRTPQSEAYLSRLAPEQAKAIADAHLLGIGEPEDVAGVVAFLLSDDARWITGTTVVVDGGLTAH